VTRECHARFSERRRVKFPPPTHHSLVHDSQWEIRMVGGLPQFHPPAFIDPQRRPLRNEMRRLAS